MQPPLISIVRVTKRFPGVTALEDVSFDVARGELHAVVGENGAGKSTLMKILSGVLGDYEGQVLLRGQSVRFRGPREAQQAGVGIIHQELNLVEQLSVSANVFLGRELRRPGGWLDTRAMDAAAAGLLAELECHARPDQPVGQLRVGDQQLVEIAKALSQEAEVLIMDEPTSALTESEVARLDRVIARLRARGVTILYISHKMDEVFRLADRITILRDGRHVRTLDRAATSPREITHLMVGRDVDSTAVTRPSPTGAPLLEVQGLSLPWRGHARGWRLRDVSFQVRRGEIVGIAGLMGAGRTELLECLFGAATDRPQGRMTLDSQRVNFHHPAEARAAGVALVTEDRKRLGLFAQMSVGQNINISTLAQLASGGLLWPGRERHQAAAAVERTGVKTASVDAAITSLSGGNQQKAIIGRWLLAEPKLLLLDDPTRGVDVGAKAELYRLLDALSRQGLAMLVTSSELPELLTLCDRILVLCEGRLTGEFARGAASEQAIMEAATLGAGQLAETVS